VAVLAGAGAPALASQNVGWLYSIDGGGAVFFDADLNGELGIEKITVCDNKTDGRGGEAEVTSDIDSWLVADPSHDGKCVVYQGNLFPEETWVTVRVWEYAGSWTSIVVHANGYA
jgi:hypothetical protein